jgi:hypothetical protein
MRQASFRNTGAVDRRPSNVVYRWANFGWTDPGVCPRIGRMRWYWWAAITVGLLLVILAAVAVTSILNFLHTAN